MADSPRLHTLINGAQGRMGTAICRVITADSRFARPLQRDEGDDDPPRDRDIDVVIDFSSDQGAQDAIRLARAHRAALLVGSTGLSRATHAALDAAAADIALLVAANTSMGIAVVATHETFALAGGRTASLRLA